MIGIKTVFSVKTALKGRLESKQITLHHYQLAKPAIRAGGWLVSFDPKRNGEYLMFLKKRKDGLYVAVTGQGHPSQSIRRLSR